MDFSIKWKLFVSFSLSMLMPILAIKLGIPLYLSLIAGTLMIFSLTWYSYYRISSALSTIKENIKPLYELERRMSDMERADELDAAMEWSVLLTSSVERSISSMERHQGQMNKYEMGESCQCTGKLSSGPSLLGQVFNLNSHEDFGAKIPKMSPDEQVELFHEGVGSLKERLEKLRNVVVNESVKGIVDFQIYFLEDPNFKQGFISHNARGVDLTSSIEALFGEFIARLEQVKNEKIKTRVKDLLDIKSQLLQEIEMAVSDKEDGDQCLKGKVLIVDHLMPSQVIRYHRNMVAGVVSREGTPSSHAQILLESLGVSSISDVKIPDGIPDGEEVALDCVGKKVLFNPSKTEKAKIAKDIEQLKTQVILHEPVHLVSGESIKVKANLNMAHESDKVHKYGADGVGLFRSEIAYLGKSHLPTEDELFYSYQEMVESLEGLPITFRMLDIGGDKLAGLGGVFEENPSMGNRSMRLLTANVGLFRSQYRAMRRSANRQASIIFPMVNGLDEMNSIMDRISEFDRELEAEGCELEDVEFGLMVEVPSVVECFADIVGHFDRFNIGTNDLTQYTLAADRNNQEVSQYYSSYHPAVIRMIEKVCRIGNKAGKSVCLCGEVALDLDALPLWVGLGVRELSVPYRYVPELKQRLKNLDSQFCFELARDVLSQNSTSQICSILERYQGSLVTT